jgi:hypothetical protein
MPTGNRLYDPTKCSFVWQPLRTPWNVLAAEQMSQIGKVFCPSQFIKEGAQMDEQADTGGGG